MAPCAIQTPPWTTRFWQSATEHFRRLRAGTDVVAVWRGFEFDCGLDWLRVVVVLSLPEEGDQDSGGGGSVEHNIAVVAFVAVEVGDINGGGDGV